MYRFSIHFFVLVGIAIWFGCIESPKEPKAVSAPNELEAQTGVVPNSNSNNETDTKNPVVEVVPFECEGANCAGESWPDWELLDFQPNSPRYEEFYGLNAFVGKTTVVVLLAGWCSYCRSQALHLQSLHTELQNEGVQINVVVLNKINASNPRHQDALIYVLDEENQIQKDLNGNPIYRCTFPLFQDSEESNVWEAHNGKKDDFYIYNSEGILEVFLPKSQSQYVSTNLSTEEGYGNLKQAILSVYRGESPSDQ